MSGLDQLISETSSSEQAPDSPPAPASREDAETITPNGTHVAFRTKPHRHYLIDDVRVISVTQALSVIDKPALPWWGMRIGVEGTLALLDKGLVSSDATAAELVDGVNGEKGLLTKHRLTVNHVKRDAADRGTRVHDALERWAKTNVLPDPSAFVEEERGYIEGLLAFIREVRPIPGGVEQIVGSKTHGFAGRGDLLRCLVPQPVIVPVRKDAKRDEWTTALIPSGAWLLDLKTSSSVYDEALLQVEAYEGASIECGFEPTEYRGVVRVDAQGRFELVESCATYDEFLAALTLFNALKKLRERRAA